MGGPPGYSPPGYPPPQDPWRQPQWPPPAAQMQNPLAKQMEERGLVWLIVAAGGWFIGLFWITGPLAWIFASKLCNEYRALGMQPHTNASAARIVGIISTVLTILGMLVIGAVVAFVISASPRYY